MIDDSQVGQQHDVVVMTLAGHTQDDDRPGSARVRELSAHASPYTIRPLAPSDSLLELTELLHRAYAPLRQRGLHYVASSQDETTTRRRIARGECWVAEWDRRLVGTVTFRPASDTRGCEWYDKADVASFEQLAVEPGLQGRGVGAALVDVAENRARSTGAVEISLDTSERAESLIAWYSGRGYRFVQWVTWEVVNYRSVVLSKDLRSHQGRFRQTGPAGS